MIRPTCFLLSASLLAAAAGAQDSPTHIEQQPSAVEPAAAQVGVSQIPGGVDRPVAQITAPDRAVRPAPQLTDERSAASAGAQLSHGPRSAREPEPLSRSTDGRTGAVARVEGRDRCAPDAKSRKPAICDRVIETRAAEFNRPAPPVLSPEQRLLVDQRLREAGLVQRAAGTGRVDAAVDPDRLESQALASVVLDPGAREEDATAATAEDAVNLPPAAAALIEAIVQRAGGQPPR